MDGNLKIIDLTLSIINTMILRLFITIACCNAYFLTSDLKVKIAMHNLDILIAFKTMSDSVPRRSI